MDTCEVLIVGGGPAGSTCAGKLRQAGLDVLLLDKEMFPRHKPCAGWITPEVLTTLAIDQEEYRQGRVLQDISSFRTGLIYGPEIVTRYGKTVSYGILRSEFDHFLLQRSAVRQAVGEHVVTLERKEGWWIVNGRFRARLVVGAGGHHCPVARLLGAKIGAEQVIVAQAAEFAMSPEQERMCSIPADTPALFFCRDLKGYGWLFRKGRYLNVGLGRMDREHLSRHTRDFCTFLEKRGKLPAVEIGRFRGHAYLLYERQGGRTCVADGALLIGDAAGLSYPQSGEGILPAIESALLAADTILAANGDYRRDNLEPYAAGLAARFGGGSELPSSPLASALLRFLGARLLSSSWFARHVVLDRWFLHTH
jgi:menaquinone-9 beta-reductase